MLSVSAPCCQIWTSELKQEQELEYECWHTPAVFFLNPFLQVCLLEIRRSRTCQRSLLLQYEHVSVQHSFLALKYCHLRSQPSYHMDPLFQIWRESFSKHLQVGINIYCWLYYDTFRIDFWLVSFLFKHVQNSWFVTYTDWAILK